jgi:hypothetical protein
MALSMCVTAMVAYKGVVKESEVVARGYCDISGRCLKIATKDLPRIGV